jgi:hypothetical protein
MAQRAKNTEKYLSNILSCLRHVICKFRWERHLAANIIYMSRRRVFCDTDRPSCEGRNPETSVPSKLDARLRGHDELNTLTPQLSVFIRENPCP